MTVTVDLSVYGLIREELARNGTNPDPTHIAQAIVGRLSDEQREQMLIRGLVERVRSLMSERRRPRLRPPDRAAAGSELRLEHISVWTGSRHVWLLDCTLDDLIAGAGEHDRMVAAHQHSSGQLRCTADVLRSGGAATVGALPPDRLAAVCEIFASGEAPA